MQAQPLKFKVYPRMASLFQVCSRFPLREISRNLSSNILSICLAGSSTTNTVKLNLISSPINMSLPVSVKNSKCEQGLWRINEKALAALHQQFENDDQLQQAPIVPIRRLFFRDYEKNEQDLVSLQQSANHRQLA